MNAIFLTLNQKNGDHIIPLLIFAWSTLDAADGFLPPVRDSRNLLQVNLLCEVSCAVSRRVYGHCFDAKEIEGDG